MLIIIGTRPEAIKIATLHNLLLQSDKFKPVLCVSGQHDILIDTALEFFNIKPDITLEASKHNTDLPAMIAYMTMAMSRLMEMQQPDIVIVQGDTATTYCGAFAAYHNMVPVMHIEAGLRTGQKYRPFPEEMYRILVDHISDIHCAPSTTAAQNLIAEGISKNSVFITGNTGTDALLWAIDKITSGSYIPDNDLASSVQDLKQGNRRIVLLTLHRREVLGQAMDAMLKAINDLAKEDIHIIFPVHKNPRVRKAVNKYCSKNMNIHLVSPLDYGNFIFLMQSVDLILTDSGGIQEEGPVLGKRVIVLRSETERAEALSEDQNILVGLAPDDIVKSARKYLAMPPAERKMIFGMGDASSKILEILETRI